jgi:dual specificity tyrosine-phosphorylation-regulated kinase 2/3/4
MSSRDSSLGSPNTSKKLLSSAQSFGSIVEEVDASVPLSSAHALKKYMSVLNSHEQLEMLEFQCIYFVGLGATKVQPNFAEPNDGYDDDNGFYRLTSGDHIAYRYEVKGLLGKGSFGQVVKAYDHKRGETVALKILRNKKRFQKQGTVEIKVLDRLRSKDPGDRNNIVKMKSCFVFRRHICIAFEQLSINLYDFVKANEFQGLSLTLIRRFTVQLLIALSVTKALNIVHCDLKPENILLCQPNKSAIKVIDFGSACFSHERVYTYIQSRFYRAPEVVLQLPYDPAIDMWSLGCILAELFTGQPLFPAENEHQLLLRLIEILDTPPLELLLHSKRRSLFFNGDGTPKLVPDRSGRIRYPRCLSLAATLSCSDGNFISFLQRCLTWDPKARLTPEEGLSHPWIRAEEGISV